MKFQDRVFEEIKAKISQIQKKKKKHIQEAQKVSNRINSKEFHTNTYNQTVEREKSNLSQIKAPPKTNS